MTTRTLTALQAVNQIRLSNQLNQLSSFSAGGLEAQKYLTALNRARQFLFEKAGFWFEQFSDTIIVMNGIKTYPITDASSFNYLPASRDFVTATTQASTSILPFQGQSWDDTRNLTSVLSTGTPTLIKKQTVGGDFVRAQFVGSVWLKSDGAATNVRLRLYNSSGGIIGSEKAITVGTELSRYAIYGSQSNGTAQVQFEVRWDSGTLYFDCMQLEGGAFASEYIDNASATDPQQRRVIASPERIGILQRYRETARPLWNDTPLYEPYLQPGNRQGTYIPTSTFLANVVGGNFVVRNYTDDTVLAYRGVSAPLDLVNETDSLVVPTPYSWVVIEGAKAYAVEASDDIGGRGVNLIRKFERSVDDMVNRLASANPIQIRQTGMAVPRLY